MTARRWNAWNVEVAVESVCFHMRDKRIRTRN